MRSRLSFAAILLTSTGSALSQGTEVPASLQTVMFKKIFAYDRALEGKDALTVLVVHSGKPSDAQKMTKAFAEVGIPSTAVETTELFGLAGLPGKIRAGTILYVVAGVNTAPVKQFCSEHGVLSISGAPALALEGDVAIGLATEEGRPRIIVNLSRLKSENHQFSSDLLGLAKVIQ